ncbi:CaiB/BaiF CoA transferase family protein [Paracoccus sp. (in: a-proteobacteria)]|uniref:CaiB/BaiF CoA transferase family protein n=1 Tax=Paracoccus sp. TaxID=267 RepID=UPI003A8B04A9
MNQPYSAPLAGLLVVDLSQFLAGPYASLRLMDLGARVIKVERPGAGDLTRSLYLSDTEIGGDSTLFHAINRGKESLAIDLKDDADRAALIRLIAQADVLIQNFRPGVIERLGFDWDSVRRINPRIVYGSISGYGEDGPWAGRPGQDLLAQARSGAMWLSGDAGDAPVPMGLAIADMFAGATLVQGMLAALVRRGVTGRGGLVQTSLIEALIDLQFEVLTTHLNDGGRRPDRAAHGSAHAYLAAPYGVYRAADGWLAIAMTPLPRLADLMQLPTLDPWRDRPDAWFTERDRIRALIADRIATRPVAEWLALFEPADIWCAPVMDWPALLDHPGFAHLGILQELRGTSRSLTTTAAPLRIDGHRPHCSAPSPQVGQHSRTIRAEFAL